IIRGKALKALIGTEPCAVASLRVIGPLGEVPSQYDEFDNPAAPNHELDADDELVFQATVPANGNAAYWLYWSTTPLPPARYQSTLMIGDALEPLTFQHDIQLWNDRCLLGLRGPARGADPTKNEAVNWGAGALVLFEIDQQPIVRGGWTNMVPLGAIACHPGLDAARWEAPRIAVHGPVRVCASTRLTDAEITAANQPAGKVDVEHRVWLYRGGAYICFEELIRAKTPIKQLMLRYEKGFSLGDKGDMPVWYSLKGTPTSYLPTPEQFAEGKKGTIIFQNADFDSWLAEYSPETHNGYLVMLDTGAARPVGDAIRMSCYARSSLIARFDRTCTDVRPDDLLTQRLWVVGLREVANGLLPLATWQDLTTPPVALGVMEKVTP
ncbi:MAG TPA: hypothetical protein VGM23_00225, partial [Armatimonadota bacterium]